MGTINPYKDFTPEEIKLLLPKRGNTGGWIRTPKDNKKNSERKKKEWASYSEEEKKAIKDKRSDSMILYWETLDEEGYEERCNQGKRVWAGYTPEEIDERMKKTFNNPEAKEKAAEGRRRFMERLTPREIGEWVSRSFQNEEAQAKKPEATQKVWDNYTKEERDKRHKNSFNSDEAFLKSAQSRKKPPSGPEILLGGLLEEYLPSKFGYNGDGRLNVRVGHRIPDYISLEGKKEAISVMGGLGYLHSYIDDTTEVEYYKERGWDILVVWDYELYLGEALEKIIAFVEEGKGR